MQKGLKLDGTMRAVAAAIGVAILTSVLAMLVPVGIWESITGSTGISELVPATGAPLGDTARALIAFLFGLLAFAVTVAILLKRTGSSPMPAKARATKAEPEKPAEDGPSFIASMKARLSEFAASRRSDDAVTELSDLPRLRPGDAHPDAPPRRPISANTDFAEIVPEPVVEPAPIVENPPLVETPVEAAIMTPGPAMDVAGMVERLEAAVALREEQLAKLEAIARAEAAPPTAVETPAEKVEVEIVESAPRPVLEAVPSDPDRQSGGAEMDAALRSALETLHRMNARTR